MSVYKLLKGFKYLQPTLTTLQSNVRLASHWNKDWRPGQYPETQAEREAAAKKYGVDVSEYKPYPDDGIGNGDYPVLPVVSAEVKDPYYPWDYPEHKRNFNEPVHAEFEVLTEDRLNVNQRPLIGLGTQVVVLISFLSAVGLTYVLLEPHKMHLPAYPKQLVTDPAPHYTFEPDN